MIPSRRIFQFWPFFQVLRDLNLQKNQNIKKSLIKFFKHIIIYIYANFQHSKLIFEGQDIFFLLKFGSKIAMFADLRGHKIFKKKVRIATQNF